jgi:hypothetical protein
MDLLFSIGDPHIDFFVHLTVTYITFFIYVEHLYMYMKKLNNILLTYKY